MRTNANFTLAATGGAIGIPLILMDGRARGAWRRDLTPSQVRLSLECVEEAARRYRRFMSRELVLHPVRTRSQREP